MSYLVWIAWSRKPDYARSRKKIPRHGEIRRDRCGRHPRAIYFRRVYIRDSGRRCEGSRGEIADTY